MPLVRGPLLGASLVRTVPRTTTRRPIRLLGAILALVCLGGLTGCVTRFQTGASLGRDHQRIVAGDLAIGGVLTRRPGEAGARLPEATARFARITGAEDRSTTISEQDLEVLLASPSEMRESAARLHALSNRLGHRYVLVGEASTAPTDVQRSWIIQVILPIPFLWISFGIPVQYASYPDVPHSTVSARVIDLERGEILAASFEVRSGIDPDETPRFRNAAAGRAVRRMALEGP